MAAGGTIKNIHGTRGGKRGGTIGIPVGKYKRFLPGFGLVSVNYKPPKRTPPRRGGQCNHGARLPLTGHPLTH